MKHEMKLERKASPRDKTEFFISFEVYLTTTGWKWKIQIAADENVHTWRLSLVSLLTSLFPALAQN
jgi:hypothetical protein